MSLSRRFSMTGKLQLLHTCHERLFRPCNCMFRWFKWDMMAYKKKHQITWLDKKLQNSGIFLLYWWGRNYANLSCRSHTPSPTCYYAARDPCFLLTFPPVNSEKMILPTGALTKLTSLVSVSIASCISQLGFSAHDSFVHNAVECQQCRQTAGRTAQRAHAVSHVHVPIAMILAKFQATQLCQLL